MRRPTVKAVISLLSIVSLSSILLLFTVFVYFFLSHWLMTREQSSILGQARQIALAYPNHLQEGSGDQNSTWLQAYLAKDQQVQVVSPLGVRMSSLTLAHQPRISLQEVPLSRGSTIVSVDGHRYVRASYPITGESGTITAWVILYSSIDTVLSFIDTLIRILILGSLGAIALAGLSGYAVAWTAINPLDRIIRLIRKVDPDRLSYRLPDMRSTREMVELTESFNKMLERIEHTMEQQNRFIEDASHELRSPLTVIEGYVNLLDRWGKADQAVTQRALLAIQKEASRLRHLTNDLLQLANLKSSPGPPPVIPVGPVVSEVVRNMQVAHERPIVHVGCEDQALVAIYPEYLQQLMMILLDNAIKHTPVNGRVMVHVSSGETFVRIAVQDDGPGIAPEHLPHVFERFYRIDPSRGRKSGAGLGLAIAKEIVGAYHGTIDVSSAPGRGTVMTVRFPRRPAHGQA